MTTRHTTARQFRVQAIRFGAIVRHALGQAATHRRLRDGSHEVILGGKVYVGQSLDQAIEQAREGRQSLP